MIHKASRYEIKIRNRANTASIVAVAAYAVGGRYCCDRTGRIKNYSRRRDVVSVESIRLPHDPERIFNLADAAEKHPRARLAREFVVSLPCELPLAVQQKLVRGYCLWMHDHYGLSSLAAIHHPLADGTDREMIADMIPRTEGRHSNAIDRRDERGNPLNQHVHILCPTRAWSDETQSFGKKLRDLDDKKKGPQIVQEMRDEWQRRVNRHLQKAGVKERVDLRSYAKMAAAGDAPEGLSPQPKLGPRNTARSRRHEQETGSDDTNLGRARAEVRAKNEALWKSWLLLRDLERAKARLEKSQRIAAKTEAARRAEATKAEAKINEAKSAEARADAIEAAPHLDALDPLARAIAWARGESGDTVDPSSDDSVDPETETAATPESEQPPKFVISRKAAQRARPPQQRVRKRGSDS